ncbi:MAG: FAD binding domain-containing protein [Anaerolineae bacterium]|nr:FAD binding domain-containing protein [Anaerolineae bacterium]
MLINLVEYHRPHDLQEALRLLSRPRPRTVPLAGGSTLLGSDDSDVEAVVDLQDLGLRYVKADPDGQAVRLGAMATLADIRRSDDVRAIYDGIIAEAAHRSAGSVLRHQATVGGAVAVANLADELLVALLAGDAQVIVHAPEETHLPLSEFLARREEWLAAHALITEVSVGQPPERTGAASQRVARTPADAPIVCAAAALSADGDACTVARLALGGVAARPLRLPEVEAMLVGQALSAAQIEAAAERVCELVQPPGDFRGSAEYRKAMAGVLGGRVLRQALARLA